MNDYSTDFHNYGLSCGFGMTGTDTTESDQTGSGIDILKKPIRASNRLDAGMGSDTNLRLFCKKKEVFGSE
jgi:hypothetical protein